MTSCRPSTSRGRSPGSVSMPEVDLRPHAGIGGAQPHRASRQRVVNPDDERADRRHAEGALHVGELREVPGGPHAEPHVVVGGPERRRVARSELAHTSVGRTRARRVVRGTRRCPGDPSGSRRRPARSIDAVDARPRRGGPEGRSRTAATASATAARRRERITRSPRTCCSAPSCGYSTPVARPCSSSTRATSMPGQIVRFSRSGEGQVGQRGRHADAVAPVHRHRADARSARGVEVVDPGDLVVHDRGEKRLLGRQELLAAPAHDRNRAVGAVVLTAEVLVGFQSAQDAQQVRPRPLLARDRGPALVVVADTADGERAVHRRPATHLPSLRVVQRRRRRQRMRRRRPNR